MRIPMPPHPISYQSQWAMPPNMSPGGTALSTSFSTPNAYVFSPTGSNYSTSNRRLPLSEMESANDYFGSVHVSVGDSSALSDPIPTAHPTVHPAAQQQSVCNSRPGIVRSVPCPDTRSRRYLYNVFIALLIQG